MTTTPPPVSKNLRDAKDVATRAKTFDAARELKEGRDATRHVPKWDRYLAAREAKEGGTFGSALEAHKDSAAWSAFSRETFAKLYDSGLGRDLPQDQRPLGSDWVEKLHEAGEALPEWRALKERARRDEWACGVAAGEALNVLAQTVTPPQTDPQSVQDELDFVKGLMEGGGKTSPKHLGRMAALQRQVKDAKEEHARAVQMLAAKGASVRSAMRKAAQVAGEAIEEMDAAMGTLGAGDGGGMMSRVNAPPQVIRAALKNNAKLRKIIRLAGRMKSAALQKQRTKARPGQEELCDVKNGSEIARLVPTELVNLATEDTEALLFRKLSENAATVYELRGKETKAEGPILMCVDESGSMNGERDMWAKAVAMALMEIAARQNRPFAYIHFNSGVSRVDEVPSPRSLSIEALGELATYFSGGGTRIGVALAHAATMLETAQTARGKNPFKRADVILVSDGDSGDDVDQTNAIKRIRAVGGHLYSVFIETTSHDPCSRMADEQVHISNQVIRSGDPSKLGEVFSI